MRIVLIFLFICSASLLFGQSRKQPLFDTAGYFHIGSSHISLYVQPSIDFVTIDNEMRQNAGLAWGMVINEGFIVGSYGNLLLNPNQFILIFPNRFNMNVIHGGLLLGYNAKITRRISCEVESRWGLGEIVINYDETGLAIKDQPIRVAQLTLGIDYQIFTFLKANASMGYRHFNEFSLAEIDQRDFSGILTQFSIKIGNFKKLRR